MISPVAFTSPPGWLSHLVNPKGGTGRCTAALLNPLHPPTTASPRPDLLSSSPALVVVGAVKTVHPTTTPSSQLEHKGSIYQYVLVTFRGQCCCSWTQRARSQRHGSVSAAQDACLGGMSGVRVRSVQAIRWSVPPRVSDTRNWHWQKWSATPCFVVLCYFIIFFFFFLIFGRWHCKSGFTWDLFPLAWQWHSPPCPCVKSQTSVAGFTRSLCPVVNRGSRFRPIVMEVAL